MTKPKPWSYQIEDRPRVKAEERPDRGGGVYVYWWNASRGKAGIRDKIRWPMKVRIAAGKLDRQLVKAAESELERIHAELARGIDPRALRIRDEEDRARRTAATAESRTIADGFNRYFHTTKGAYAAETRDVRELKRYRRLIERFIGPDTAWAALDADAGTHLSRQLAVHYSEDSGFRASIRIVDLLFRAGEWLRVRKLIPVDACLRPDSWASKMRQEWERLGKDVSTDRPRYTRSELSRLLSSTEKADPRLKLAFDIGPEFRAVNLRATMRTDLDLDAVGDWGLGRLRVAGNSSKRGALVDVDPALRESLDQALQSGHLAALETQRRQGEIGDYPLFPGRGSRPLGRTGFRLLFKAYEEAAKVPHLEGRGWHAIRRSLSDALTDETDDENVRDQAGGWRLGGGTRKAVYNDDEDPRLIARTRHAVLATRHAVMDNDPELKSLRQEAMTLIWNADRPQLEAALETLKQPKLTPLQTPARTDQSA